MKQRIITLAFILVGFNSIAQQNFFQNINENFIVNKESKRVIKPKEYRTLSLNINSLKSFLTTLPDEKNVLDRNNTPILEIPMPDGSTAKFNVWQSLVMEQGLADAFPNIRTYLGQGITDKYATIRFDVTELGFHAMILSATTGSVFIDPYNQTTTTEYISYFKKDFNKENKIGEKVIRKSKGGQGGSSTSKLLPAGQCNGAQLRKYRLAVACTNQYAKAATGNANPSKAQTISAITTTVNRVNQVYENEVSIRLLLVANNQNIVYVNTVTDTALGPFDQDPGNLIDKSQSHITLIIGSANFDIGHTFSTGGGGLALLGSVCDDNFKASGITGQATPVGDPFDIDFVAHEIGHQFGGEHTFNAATGFCDGNANSSPASFASNVEPGSGSTIMAYAGICNEPGVFNDLQPNSDPQFHAASLAQILDFSILDVGNNCAVISNTGNTAPVVTVSNTTMTIPINTPFLLRGSATDINNDSLTYSWEQMDVGGAEGNWDKNPQTVNIPLFRSFQPIKNGNRMFPNPSYTGIGERLPSIARVMKFRLTVRDNRAGGGGTCFKDVTVNTNSTVTGFDVTYPTASGITWLTNESRTILWNRNATHLGPYNIANVAIELSIDGGVTYPIVLAANTPNDGTQVITVPNNITTNAKVRVTGINNTIFSVSNNEFEIKQNPLPVKWLDFTGTKKEKHVVLNWTVNEVSNNYYNIERSVDGVNFEKIGLINSTANSSNNKAYSFTDFSPIEGKNYYRIKQVDVNAHYTYSSTINILSLNKITTFTVYPNPTKNNVNLFVNEGLNNVNISIFDINGKQVYSEKRSQITKGDNINIQLKNLNKGVYVLKLFNESISENVKLVIE